ncbi:Phosphatidylinositol-glycan biosynthesis class S protein [Popillia japonica]|uniref:Phosphatidylinositol-glycan biosynthesis class S protein n=1 Tax=Popillia japonica TaxID=7064 RepID=A0AAW1KH35_POPJA
MDSNSETPEKTADDRFKDDPEAIYRIYSIVSYFVVLVIIGVPVWWFTTRVYRAPLPLDEMLDYDISHKIIRENSIPLSLDYDVLITILNPDPRNLTVELDGRILKANLDPFLKTISAVANFTVKSQWLYLTELGVPPKMVDKDNYVIYEEQLPLILTPLEKKVWSHLSPRPTLNLVTYISKCDTPLYIHNRKDKVVDSNAFLNPRWGGISIINADKESCIKGIYTPDISRIISIYITQLKELIGLHGTTQKDIDDLAKTKSVDMITSTRRTLKSLALLLSEINSIVISDEVAQKIKLALENVNKADSFLNSNDLTNALQSSKLAYYNSEGAFSDPSLLALLYFPDDQKYAIYIPLFLPIMIPVFMSLTTLRKWYTQENVKKQKVD